MHIGLTPDGNADGSVTSGSSDRDALDFDRPRSTASTTAPWKTSNTSCPMRCEFLQTAREQMGLAFDTPVTRQGTASTDFRVKSWFIVHYYARNSSFIIYKSMSDTFWADSS